MNAQELIKENNRLKNKRGNVESTWRQVNQFISLRHGVTLGISSPGSKQTNRLYDGTALKANRDLAAWMNNNLTSMSMEWFSLRLGVRGAPVDKTSEEWLEECQQRLYDALRASNFQAEAQKLYLDLPSFCTAAMYMEEQEITKAGFNGFLFVTLAPGEYCVILDKNGRTAGLYREFELSAQECWDKWGERISDEVKDKLKSKPLEMIKILHAVFPAEWYGGKHKTDKEYASYYAELSGKKVLDQGGYSEFPFFVVPWERSSGEDYGNGPGFDALPDIMTLNEARMLSLMEMALAIRPPIMALDDGVIGSVKLQPGGITTITKPDALKQFITQARFSDVFLNEENLRNAIRTIFHNDLVRFLPPVQESKNMTATEVAQRAELVRLLGPAFGNLTDFWLDPMIERAFYIMLRAGAFSPPPDAIRRMAEEGRENFKIEYEGPLAKAQRSQDVDAIIKTMQVLQPLSEIYPDIPDNFDSDQLAQVVAAVMGVPKKIMRPKDGDMGILAMREARAQAAMEQKRIEQGQGVAEIAEKTTGAMQQAGPDGMKALMDAAGGTV